MALARWYLDLIAGGCVFLGAAGLTVVATLNDIVAFAALATPATYAWLCLSLLCWAGLVFTSVARRRGLKPPAYFRVVMFVGVAGALWSVPTAWRVLTKTSERTPIVHSGAPADLRGARLVNKNYAERDMAKALMTGTQLVNVDLSGANLSETDLRKAQFTDVDMSVANLCGADIRGADLRGARNLESVRNWAYAFYDDTTRLPEDLSFTAIAGPVKDTGRGLLYMCRTNRTRRIAPREASAIKPARRGQ